MTQPHALENKYNAEDDAKKITTQQEKEPQNKFRKIATLQVDY